MLNPQFKSAESFSGWKLLLVTTLLFTFINSHGAEGIYEPQMELTGQTFTHDPSTVIEDNGTFYDFGTAPGIRVMSSSDLVHWTNAGRVFQSPPAWTKIFVPAFKGTFWAPDIIHVNGKFYLYYAVSTIGKQVSAIGLATTPTLDTTATNFAWTDCGVVIASTNNSPYNTIDPSVMSDANGKLWLAFGSYWQGIFLTELNPQTGLRLATNSPIYNLAWNHSIEASCLTQHDKYYYLFVNWGTCCQGTNSTYEVRIGRAEKVTGPYLDRNGKNMVDEGGSVFLHTSGRFFGPGHIGILNEGGTNWFSYHYYDAATQGRSRLAIGKLNWTNGWPVPTN